MFFGFVNFYPTGGLKKRGRSLAVLSVLWFSQIANSDSSDINLSDRPVEWLAEPSIDGKLDAWRKLRLNSRSASMLMCKIIRLR